MPNLPSQKDAESSFWRVMRVLLILGFVCLCGEALLLWRPAQDNQTGQALASSIQHFLGGWFARALLGIGVWAGAIAFCALLLKSISGADALLKAAAAMWRPLVLLAVAGYLLFFNDQGRELGVSLMGETKIFPIIFLFLALVYWAANTWHTARLGIHAALAWQALGVPVSKRAQNLYGHSDRHVLKGDERWLFWLPRLLGVCAHFFAAINLSLAAWALPLAAWGESYPAWLRWLSWTAPLAILLATALVWAEDVKRSKRCKAITSPDKQAWARRVGLAAEIGETALLGALALAAYFLRDSLGFLLGTIFISLSAVAFLGLISWLRNQARVLGPEAGADERAEDDERERKEAECFTKRLFGIAVFVAALVWISPIFVGRYLGSMVVVYFAFGAILALVNAFELAIVSTTRRGWFGEKARPRVVGAYAVAFMFGLAALNAWLHPFHRVRVCDGGDCVAKLMPDDRPKVADAARAWYEQAKAGLCEDARRRARADVHRGDGWRRHPRRLLDRDDSRAARGRFRAQGRERAPLSLRHQRRLRRQRRRGGLRGGACAARRDSLHSGHACQCGGQAWRCGGQRRNRLPPRHEFSHRGFPGAGSRELDIRGHAVELSAGFRPGRSRHGARTKLRACERRPAGATVLELLSLKEDAPADDGDAPGGVRSFCSTPHTKRPASASSPAMS